MVNEFKDEVQRLMSVTSIRRTRSSSCTDSMITVQILCDTF